MDLLIQSFFEKESWVAFKKGAVLNLSWIDSVTNFWLFLAMKLLTLMDTLAFYAYELIVYDSIS